MCQRFFETSGDDSLNESSIDSSFVHTRVCGSFRGNTDNRDAYPLRGAHAEHFEPYIHLDTRR